jgi:hypothetical protein
MFAAERAWAKWANQEVEDATKSVVVASIESGVSLKYRALFYYAISELLLSQVTIDMPSGSRGGSKFPLFLACHD